MKKIKNLLLMILILLSCPIIVKADTFNLEYSYDRLAKLGNEAQYTFGLRRDEYEYEYEYFVTYDKQYLKFEKYYRIFSDGACGPDTNLTVKEDNGKITVKKEKGCPYNEVTLIFTTLKEGTTELEVTGGTHTTFHENVINVSTEIINTNKECEKCPEEKECEKCPEVKECEKCPELNECSKNSSDNIILYVVLGLIVILNVVTIIFALKSNKLNKKSAE